MKDQFAILHKFEDTQFLVFTDYDHEEEEFKLTYRFWCEYINGYIEATMSWNDTHEEYWQKTFNKFRDREYSEMFMNGTIDKFTKK